MAKGRPKKDVYIPREESLSYAKEALENYCELQQQCRAFEKMNETLFQEINTDKLKEMIDSGAGDKVPKGLYLIMESYLGKKEQTMLVSNALEQMPEDIMNIIKWRCIDRKSMDEIMAAADLSRATVKRRVREGMRIVAEHVEVYMWCKAVKALGL